MSYSRYGIDASEAFSIRQEEAAHEHRKECIKLSRKDKYFRRLEEVLEFSEDRETPAWKRIRAKLEAEKEKMIENASECIKEWDDQRRTEESLRYL